jgi:hypothetical protein
MADKEKEPTCSPIDQYLIMVSNNLLITVLAWSQAYLPTVVTLLTL